MDRIKGLDFLPSVLRLRNHATLPCATASTPRKAPSVMAPIRVCEQLLLDSQDPPSEDWLVLIAHDSQRQLFAVTSYSLVILPQSREKHFPSFVE